MSSFSSNWIGDSFCWRPADKDFVIDVVMTTDVAKEEGGEKRAVGHVPIFQDVKVSHNRFKVSLSSFEAE
jgi:hypothetical protein